MVNIFITLKYIYSLPKLGDPFNQIFFIFRLNFFPNEFLHLMPEILYGVDVRGLWWSFEPIYSIFFKEHFPKLGCVLGIIVLYKSIPIWVNTCLEY